MGTEIKKNQVSKRSDVPKKFTGGEILLNLMFRGQYLQDNIGHEIINMFKADDNEYYIYVNPYGTFGRAHSGKIETILLGRHAGNNLVELIAKAEELEEIVDIKSNKKDNIKEAQKDFCKNICYGKMPIVDIFKGNKSADEQIAWISFHAKKYRKIRDTQKIYITTDMNKSKDKNIFYIGNPDANDEERQIHFPKQSLKAYYKKCDKKTGHAYDALHKLIQNDNLWEDDKNAPISMDYAKDDYDNFLKLIKKENDELSFSNLFAHYLSHRFGLMGSFARSVLRLEITGHYMIEREWKNIDLLIEDDSQIIVIENKIKSKINGIRDDGGNQLKEYIKKARDRAEKEGKQIKFFIFSPNYNHIELKTYAGGKEYTPIPYSYIFDFFSKNTPKNPDNYYDDFVKALYKHTRDYADDLYGEMRQKFAAAIFQK